MKNTLLTTLCFFIAAPGLFAQDVNPSIGIGFFGALPQHELKDIEYDKGYGMNLSYMSRKFSLSNTVHFNWGVRMDISSMDKREFEPVPINTPVPDEGKISVHNSMYGLFGIGRFSYGTGRFTPYAELLIGHRNFNTKQIITAMNPELNPEYESSTTYDRVVHTRRFHYGGSLGISYRIGSNFYLESSVTYTEGNAGWVMPLKDVVQEEQMMKYNYKTSATDMLLINAGIRIRLGSRVRSNSSGPGTSGPPAPTSTRYKDKDKDSTSSDTKKEETNTKPPEPPKKKLEVTPATKPLKNGTKKS